MSDIPVFVSSIFGYNERKPFVKVQFGEIETLMTPTKAREIAGMLNGAAEASETDAMIFEFARKIGKAQPEEVQEALAADMLKDLRAFRKNWEGA